MEFLDPRAEPLAQPEPYDLSQPLEPGTTVALLANGYPDSVPFLEHIEAALSEAFDGLTFKHYDKGDASVVVSPEMLAEIEEECQAVIAAYGH
ncbi:MAG: hypothetical protein OEV40_24510 [Acidimicrobiia bacterium]|nr:hypothetical protein [Acidimicrobiia bacterium]